MRISQHRFFGDFGSRPKLRRRVTPSPDDPVLYSYYWEVFTDSTHTVNQSITTKSNILEAQRKSWNERGSGRAARPIFLSNFHFSFGLKWWAEMKIPFQLPISISAGWRARRGARAPALPARIRGLKIMRQFETNEEDWICLNLSNRLYYQTASILRSLISIHYKIHPSH